MLAVDKVAIIPVAIVKAPKPTSEGSAIVAFKPAGGHDEHHAAPGIDSLTWPAINFAIFFAICVWAYKTKLAPVLVKRAEDFERSLKQSDVLLEQAQTELSAAEAARRALPADTERLVAQALEDARNLSASIAEDATKQVTFMKQSLEKRLMSEQVAAEDEVKLKMIEQASTISRESLRKDLSPDQDRSFRERCFQQFVDLVKS